MASAQMENEVVWRGPGWYGPRQEWGRVRWFFLGNEEDQPNTAGQGVGTPFWFDTEGDVEIA